MTAIPPEFQAGILLIVSTLTGLAIPAIGLFVTKVTLMAAPFHGGGQQRQLLS
jgi:hypothetical protein